MEIRKFKIKYAILVNGDEYPNTAEFSAVTPEEAKQQLIDLLKPDVDYKIHEVSPL